MSKNKNYRAAIITANDNSASGKREDLSGRTAKEILEKNGINVVSCVILPDEKQLLCAEMVRLSDRNLCDVIITTGGTGLSLRDVTPEATISISDRMVPGIAEAIRSYGMITTKRAMLSRGVSAIRGSTLIVNLPSSPNAVKESLEYILDELIHGIAVLRGDAANCAGYGNALI
ncbi:MAG: MogA/MoaB family molybdenum cofactor biosynthesis protein [Clostridiales bacterium]|nr:MogA/MoaB family molybdenum cofactor biosynthesis protein [Clostridiales bacterium]